MADQSSSRDGLTPPEGTLLGEINPASTRPAASSSLQAMLTPASGNERAGLPTAIPVTDRGKSWLQSVLHEIREIAVATWGQTCRCASYVVAWWRGRSATRALARAQYALGERITLVQQEAPPGAETEYQKAKELQTSLRQQVETINSARASLFPRDSAGWRRAGIGYGMAGCVLVLVMILLFPGRGTPPAPGEEKAFAAIIKLGGEIGRDVNKPEQPIIRVRLSDLKVSDTDLKDLNTLKDLESLSLDGTQVTDAGLKDLTALKQLRYLYLGGTQVTNAGLKDLAALTQLRDLVLSSTKVTDVGVKDLAALNQLQWLFLDGTQLTDAGLKDLAAFKHLEFLSLDGTQVTDTGLKDLAALNQLRYLFLSNTKMTDAGLRELATFRKLKTLNLHGIRVTDRGLDELRKALPDCEINR